LWANGTSPSAPAHHGGGGLLGGIEGFVHNAGNDALNFITQGMPALGGLIGNNFAAISGIPELYGLTGLPGSNYASHILPATLSADKQFVKGTFDYYVNKYGPILGSIAAGHPGSALEQFGHALYKNPLYTGLDVASLVTGGEGAIAKIGTLAARGSMDLSAVEAAQAAGQAAAERAASQAAPLGADVAKAAGDAALAMAGADPMSIAALKQEAFMQAVRDQPAWLRRFTDQSIGPESPRYRAPIKGEVSPGEGAPPQSVEVPRRPYSAKPLERAIQKGTDWIKQGIADRFPDSPIVGDAAKAARYQAKVARMGRTTAKARGLKIADHMGAAALTRAIKGLGSMPLVRELRMNEIERFASTLFAKGVTIDQAEAFFRRKLAEYEAAGRSTKDVAYNLHLAERVPNDMRNLETAPARVQRVVAEIRNLNANSREYLAAGAGMTVDQMRQRAYNEAAQIAGVSKYDPATGAFTKPPADWKPAYDPQYTGPVRARTRGAGERPPIQHGNMFAPVKMKSFHGMMTADQTLDPSLLVAYHRDLLPKIEMNRTLFGTDPHKIGGIVNGFLFHDENGAVISGSRAAQLLHRYDPNTTVLVYVGTLRKGFQRASDLADASAQFDQAMRNFEVSPEIAAGLERGVYPAGTKASDYVLMSKSGYDALLNGARGASHGALGIYDGILNTWKGLILGLRPAFLVHVTLSHLTQYAMLAANDMRAILDVGAADGLVRQAMERVDPGVGMGFSGTEPPSMYRDPVMRKGHYVSPGIVRRTKYQAERIPASFFHFNDWIQERIRAGGWYSQAKQVARDQGFSVRQMTPDQIIQAIADNPALTAETSRRFTAMLGDYIHFSPFEQDVMRRIFPFYSWLRVATRLAFNLPLEHPLRAQMLAVSGIAAQAVMDPQGIQGKLPIYSRGYEPLLGTPLGMGTGAYNPFTDVGNIISGLMEGGPQGVAQALYSSSASPIVQLIASQVTGTDPMTGQPFYSPSGFDGTFTSSHGATMKIDPVTGLPTYTQAPVPSIFQQIAEQLPGESTLRALLSGSQHPYATTSDLALIENALGHPQASQQQLFAPSSKAPPAVGAIPYLTTLAQFGGLPVKTVDPQNELAVIQHLLAAYNAAQQNTQASQQQAANTLGGG
jgi:hypothetical protein